MKRIVVATNNTDKLNEIRAALDGMPFEAVGMKTLGIDSMPDETGSTFIENAMIKATALFRKTGGYVLADDSGLCVDALGGAPGIYSSRFFGEDTSYREKFAELSRLLKDVPLQERTAYFSCAMVLLRDDAEPIIVEERMDGILLNSEFGKNGFGYDPIFYVPEFGRTAAELTSSEKLSVSHRGKAIRALMNRLSAL
jgi:XTP/dITP diphosphohydrolase